MKAWFIGGPRGGSSCEVADTVDRISVPTIISTCLHYEARHGSFPLSTTVTYRKAEGDFSGSFFRTEDNFAEAYFCQQCYSEKKATLEAENLKASIRKEVIYELQSFLKEFE